MEKWKKGCGGVEIYFHIPGYCHYLFDREEAVGAKNGGRCSREGAETIESVEQIQVHLEEDNNMVETYFRRSQWLF